MTGGRNMREPQHQPQSHQQSINWRQVWKDNLEEEMGCIQDAVELCQCVAFDALLPGTVVHPLGIFENGTDYNYRRLKTNVDLTTVIQISLVLTDEEGRMPPSADGSESSAWKFNFAFDAAQDIYSPESLDPLCRARGVDLRRHREHGIKSSAFAEQIFSSGLVLNENLTWLTYDGPDGKGLSEVGKKKGSSSRQPEQQWAKFSGTYHLAHLLQLLQQQPLPEEHEAFDEALDLYFPARLDIARYLHQCPKHVLRPNDQLANTQAGSSGRFGRAEQVLEVFASLPAAARQGRTDSSLHDNVGSAGSCIMNAARDLPGSFGRADAQRQLWRPAATAF